MMGGVVGAVSGKFVLMAATLLLHAKVDRTAIEAVVDPAAATSSISRPMAERLRLTGASARRAREVTIGIGAESFTVPGIAIDDGQPGAPVFRIGRDILAAHVFAIDFRSRTIRIVLPSEYGRFTPGFDPIPLTRDPSGGLQATARVGVAPQTVATVDLGDAVPLRIESAFAQRYLQQSADDIGQARLPLLLGDVALPDVTPVPGDAADPSPVTIGLPAFAHSSILLDLPHDRIWVRKGRAPRT